MSAKIEPGHPIEGLSWAAIWNAPENRDLATAISRCWWITEADWEQDRQLRLKCPEKFHSHGHKSEQEAIECYQEFLKDLGVLLQRLAKKRRRNIATARFRLYKR
jgi:hypothetical protein